MFAAGRAVWAQRWLRESADSSVLPSSQDHRVAPSEALDNHKAAVALHFCHSNFCEIHRSVRVTRHRSGSRIKCGAYPNCWLNAPASALSIVQAFRKPRHINYADFLEETQDFWSDLVMPARLGAPRYRIIRAPAGHIVVRDPATKEPPYRKQFNFSLNFTYEIYDSSQFVNIISIAVMRRPRFAR